MFRIFFNDAINSNVKNPKKIWAGMHELTGLKSYSATNHIQDEDGNIIKMHTRLQLIQ